MPCPWYHCIKVPEVEETSRGSLFLWKDLYVPLSANKNLPLQWDLVQGLEGDARFALLLP